MFSRRPTYCTSLLLYDFTLINWENGPLISISIVVVVYLLILLRDLNGLYENSASSIHTYSVVLRLFAAVL